MAKEKEKERDHSILSASGAHKWLNCPPSARLEEALPDKAGDAAKEGTVAHSLCELKLSKLFTDKNMTTRTYNSRLKKIQEDEKYQPEMERFTDEYVDYVREIAFAMPAAPTVVVEKRVDYGAYAPEGFGTADCLLLQGNTLHVIDFKYGKGVPVSAEGNPQLGLYALGALAEYGFIYPVEKVVLHIVQPRIPNSSSWETTVKELLAWGKYVKEKAELAYRGEGEFHEGKWCDSCFCKIAGTCRHRADKHMQLMEVAAPNGEPRDIQSACLSDEEVGNILKKAQYLASWVKKLEAYAQNRLLDGGKIPGWKLVEGRSTRKWSDQDAAFRQMQAAGIDEAMLYTRTPISLTVAEKMIGKKKFAETMSAFITKAPGAPKLANDRDPRPAYNNLDGFKAEED